MNKFIEYKKLSKKKKKEYNKKHRVTNPFNTGTRVMKTDKHPSRARKKELDKQHDIDNDS